MARVFGKVVVGICPSLSDIDSGPIVEPEKLNQCFQGREAKTTLHLQTSSRGAK